MTSEPPVPGGESLRSTPLDTVFNTLLAAAWIVILGGPLVLAAAQSGRGLSSATPPTFLLITGVFALWIWVCAFLTALVLSPCIFLVRLDSGSITYWDGFGRHRLEAADIREICFLKSLFRYGTPGLRYIVIRTDRRVHSLAINLWSKADFARLSDRIEAWRASGGFSFPLTHDDTYSHRTPGELWSGSKNLPRVYRRYMGLCAAVWAAIAVITAIVARLV